MKIVNNLLMLATGAGFGVALVLSCSDSPNNADAALCDCPAAEPPLAGRVTVVKNTQTVQPGASLSQGVACPGGVVLSGSCGPENDGDNPDVTLRRAGFSDVAVPDNWQCVFQNNEPTPITFKVMALCLMPPAS